MYESLEARLHDAFWNAEEGPGELELLRTFHRRHPGRALELGCGSGRLLLPLLAEGLEVQGIDRSREMLELCRTEAVERGLEPILHHRNIESPDLPEHFRALARREPERTGDSLRQTDRVPGPPGSFAALSLPAFTFQLVEDPAQLLANCYQLLAPHGGLYLTAFVPHAELEGDLPEHEWYPDRELVLPDGNRATVETRHSLHPGRRLLVREHRYALHAPDGSTLQTHDCTESIHWLHPDELTHLLAEHMFTVSRTITDFDPSDDTPADEATVFTLFARRSEIIV